MDLAVDLVILIGSVLLGSGAGWAEGYLMGYRKHRKRAEDMKATTEAERAASESPTEWEVRVIANPNYYYKDDEGKHTKDKHTCLEIRLVKDGCDPVKTEWFDIRKDETEEKVKVAVAAAEAKAEYMNLLDVNGVVY